LGGLERALCMTTTDIFMENRIWEAGEWRASAGWSYKKCWFVYASQEIIISNLVRCHIWWLMDHNILIYDSQTRKYALS
jgi:hypothetical protein